MGRIELSELLQFRLRQVEPIWDSIAESPGPSPLTDADREELDRRWADYANDPTAGSPWSEALARIRSR